MNYLLVNYEYPPMGGGAANATWFLARAWARQGHGATVVTAAHRDLPRREERDGVAVFRIPARRRAFFEASIPEMSAFIGSALLHAPSIARRRKIDRVAAFFTIPGGPVGYWLKKALGLPYLVLQRGGDVPGFEPGLDAVHRMLTPFRRALLRASQAVTANDRGLSELSQRADPFPVTVVPNGVDTDFWTPEPRPRGNGNCRFLAGGRLVGQKNIGYLLTEFAGVVHGSGADFQLSIMGDGRDRPQLEHLASVLGIRDRVCWLGWLSKDELRRAYRDADALLNPSLYEGMPNTVLEAMACGLPAVVSDVPGNNTLVTDMKTGLICNLDGRPGLADCLRRIHLNRALLGPLGPAARRHVEEHHSWDVVARCYDRLFESGPKTGRPPETTGRPAACWARGSRERRT